MLKPRLNSYRKRQRQQKLPLLAIVMAVPVVLILLELLARLLVGVSGKSADLTAYESSPHVYRLKFLDQKKKPYDGLSDKGQLAAQRSLALGYQLVGNQKNNFWQINEKGFRDDRQIPLPKPQGEFRIFILGGSTTFGQGNPNEKSTLADKLETRLNERIAQQRRSPEKYRPQELPFYKPDLRKALALPPKLREGNYRVINAGVPGYAAGNELAQLALQILPYSPDAIVVLDGYTDLILPSDRAAMDIPRTEEFLSNASGHFRTVLSQRLNYAISSTYLVRAIRYWILRPQPTLAEQILMPMDDTTSLEQHLATDANELKRRVDRYQNYHRQMVLLAAGRGIPLVIALQPEITGNRSKEISASEQKILAQLGKDYKQRVKMGYTELASATQELQQAFPKNVKVINFFNIYEDLSDQAFLDTIHLTEKGNTVLSEKLYKTLTAIPKLQIPPSRPIPEK